MNSQAPLLNIRGLRTYFDTEAGVAKAIDIIRGGLDLTMGMCGHRTPAEINRNTLM